MRCSYFERSDTPVGWTGYVELAVFNFVVRKNLFKKLWKNLSPVPQNQMILRSSRRYDDIPALLRFRSEVSVKNSVHGVHGLCAATESEDCWINFGWIIGVRKDNFVMNRCPPNRTGLIEHFGPSRLSPQQCGADGGYT